MNTENSSNKAKGNAVLHGVSGSFIALQRISAGVYLKFNKELNLSLADCEEITKFIIEENNDLVSIALNDR
jgi:hypothetical protein